MDLADLASTDQLVIWIAGLRRQISHNLLQPHLHSPIAGRQGHEHACANLVKLALQREGSKARKGRQLSAEGLQGFHQIGERILSGSGPASSQANNI